MAADDYAVVVGLTHYPGMGDLQGPERDAIAFYRWLRDPKLGDVPKNHITFIGTTIGRFHPPLAKMASQARPRHDDVTNPFDTYLADSNGGRLGRRLYMYFSGHGLSASFAFMPTLADAALLMPNASKANAPHVFGKIYAQYFMKAGIFDEVALFMDCCRDVYPLLSPQLPTYTNLTKISTKKIDRGFYAYATEWGTKTREKPINGHTRGIFTHTLLEGLTGKACDASGRVTSASLSDYLKRNMRNLMTPQELATLPNEPIVEAPHPMVFAEIPPPTFPVTFQVDNAFGHRALLIDGGFDEIDRRTIVDSRWTLFLKKGLYLLDVTAPDLSRRPSTKFQVEGTLHVRA